MNSSSAKTLSALLQQSSIHDHNEILATSQTALQGSKDDSNLQHIILVALIKLDRYEDAHRFVKQWKANLGSQALLEEAYILYKLGKYQEARSLAQSIHDSRGARYLEAQASYRLEDFIHAQSILRGLNEEHPQVADENNDLRINHSAVESQLAWTQDSSKPRRVKPLRQDLEAFETAYNYACHALARHDFLQASALLQRAKEICNALDELSEDDKAAELLPILVQQIYALVELGRFEEAQSIMQSIPLDGISDTTLRACARHNAIISRRMENDNPYQLQKSLEIDHFPESGDLAFAYQAGVLKTNLMTADLNAYKLDGVDRRTGKLAEKAQPSVLRHENLLSTINAAAHTFGMDQKQTRRTLAELVERRPLDIGLALTAIQVCAVNNNIGQASGILERLFTKLATFEDPSFQYVPGLIALQVSLHAAKHRHRDIANILANSAIHWIEQPSPPISLLHTAGLHLLAEDCQIQHSQNFAMARKIFQKLLDLDPTCPRAKAGLIAASVALHSSTTSLSSSSLPPVASLISGIDTEKLEEQGITMPTKILPKAFTAKRPLDVTERPRKKRIQQSRKPKTVTDSNKQPDPERWLPLRERSNYRSSGKKGKRKEADRERTQGGPVGTAMSTDVDSNVANGKGQSTVVAAAAGKKKKKARK